MANEKERPLTKSAKKTSASRAKAKPGASRKPAAKKAGIKKAAAKKPAAAKPAAKSVVSAPSEKHLAAAKGTLKVILAQLEDMKAEDSVTIDLKGTSSVADFVVVTTGRSNRHVASIADRVVDGLREVGVRAKVEGMEIADWVLVDAGDVIVHVFRPEVRTFYNLEKMWTGAAALHSAS